MPFNVTSLAERDNLKRFSIVKVMVFGGLRGAVGAFQQSWPRELASDFDPISHSIMCCGFEPVSIAPSGLVGIGRRSSLRPGLIFPDLGLCLGLRPVPIHRGFMSTAGLAFHAFCSAGRCVPVQPSTPPVAGLADRCQPGFGLAAFHEVPERLISAAGRTFFGVHSHMVPCLQVPGSPKFPIIRIYSNFGGAVICRRQSYSHSAHRLST